MTVTFKYGAEAMIMDFDPERVAEWLPYGRINTIRFHGCLVRVDEYDAEKTGLAKVTKMTKRTTRYFGPFDYFNDKHWHIKALIAALQGDELNSKNLAKLVALRLQG